MMRLGGLVLLSGCGPIPFEATVKGETTVTGSPLGQLLTLFPQVGGFTNIDFDSNQDFQNNDADRQHVKTMTLKDFRLRIISPASQDFSFLDTLRFSLRSGDTETLVASKRDIAGQPGVTPNATLSLDLEPVDVASYVRASQVTIVSAGSGRQPPQDTRIEATIDFEVGVGL